MVSIAIACQPIHVALQILELNIDLIPILLGGLKILADIAYLLPVLIKQCLGIGYNFVDFLVNLTDSSNILVIVIFYDVCYNFGVWTKHYFRNCS